MMNFIILLLAMSASGAIGFYLARAHYLGQSAVQLHNLDAELQKVRRHARNAETQAARAKADHDRLRRTSLTA
ncbi:hypothetical protein [uncultured Litoreibacter sp.]|uniref:hypothetical protein n=1 Tax=uncultured Litoreibacter sp. TaxID=1392394 RepID=UPI002603B6AE|nr:hypothetical protein [uncultured Litoreibacter sp.]